MIPYIIEQIREIMEMGGVKLVIIIIIGLILLSIVPPLLVFLVRTFRDIFDK